MTNSADHPQVETHEFVPQYGMGNRFCAFPVGLHRCLKDRDDPVHQTHERVEEQAEELAREIVSRYYLYRNEDDAVPDNEAMSEIATLIEPYLKGEWQPIESAPKDGSALLLWWPYWSQTAVLGSWSYDRWECEYALSDGPDPTHWMPLPDPPKER